MHAILIEIQLLAGLNQSVPAGNRSFPCIKGLFSRQNNNVCVSLLCMNPYRDPGSRLDAFDVSHSPFLPEVSNQSFDRSAAFLNESEFRRNSRPREKDI